MPKPRKTPYNEQMRRIFAQYQAAHPNETAVESESVYHWAKKNNLWLPHIEDEAKIFARQLGQALREEKRVDASGRPHRGKLAVTMNRGGKQYTIWGDIETFPRKYVVKSVAQRRNQIVGDCFGLQMDLEHYNDAHPLEVPIQTHLDFRDDVEEKKLEILRKNAA